MADEVVPISALAALDALADDDELVARDDSEATLEPVKRLTAAQLAAYVAAAVGDAGVATPSGELTGDTIREQLDELDLRTRAGAFIDRAETRIDLVEHFLGVASAAHQIGALGWNAAIAQGGGSGAAVTLPFGVGHTRTLDTGTGATASVSMNLGVAALNSTPVFDAMFVVSVPTLSTETQEFIARVGLHNGTTTTPTAGAGYFEYNRLSSANWRFGVCHSSTPALTTTSVPVVAGQSYILRIVSTGAAVAFYIDGEHVGTVTTNLADGTDFWGVNFQIVKSAGGTARTLVADRFAGAFVG